MKISKLFLFSAALFVSYSVQIGVARAQEQSSNSGGTNTTSTNPPAGGAQQFEIIDGTSPIAGDSAPLSLDARTKWKKACDEWKKETKDYNKENHILAISCGNADCKQQDNGSFVCSSTGSYKLKIAGVMVRPPPPAPAPAPLPVEHVIETAPPEVIVEATPLPRPGFVWIAGYWGWEGHRHLWYPGYWAPERPGYIWIGHRWERRGPGWHFDEGHWGRR